jgi:hypothetical protein
MRNACMQNHYNKCVLRRPVQTRSYVASRFHEVLSKSRLLWGRKGTVVALAEGKLTCDISKSASVFSAKTVVKMSSVPTRARPHCVISWEVHSPPLHNDYYGEGAGAHDQKDSRTFAARGCRRRTNSATLPIQIWAQVLARHAGQALEFDHSVNWNSSASPLMDRLRRNPQCFG